MSRIRMRKTASAFRAARREDGVTVAQAPNNLRKSLTWVVVPTALAALGSAWP